MQMEKATLLLVRHGQTAWNASGRVQGASDTPLDAVGREQARRVARRLASEPIAAVYASDLSRAAETARIIWEHVNAAGPTSVRLRLCSELRELGYGEWEGKTRADLEAAGWGEALRKWHAGLSAALPPGAEGKKRADARVRRSLACVRSAEHT